MEAKELFAKYNCVTDGLKRNYMMSVNERRYDMESTEPVELSIHVDRSWDYPGDDSKSFAIHRFTNNSWIRLIEAVALYLQEKAPKTKEELLAFRTEWSDAIIFSDYKAFTNMVEFGVLAVLALGVELELLQELLLGLRTALAEHHDASAIGHLETVVQIFTQLHGIELTSQQEAVAAVEPTGVHLLHFGEMYDGVVERGCKAEHVELGHSHALRISLIPSCHHGQHDQEQQSVCQFLHLLYDTDALCIRSSVYSPKNVFSILFLVLSLSRLMAFSLICLTRSRVRPYFTPISSNVIS